MNVIALDYETAIEGGGGSVEYYRHDFRVTSMALSWMGKEGVESAYYEGEEAIRQVLLRLMGSQRPIIAHNYQFEYGVTLYRFPGIELNWVADTMRLVQVADNGGEEPQTLQDDLEGGRSYATGLGLQASISRWLPPQYHNHKAPYYAHLRDVEGVKKGKEGAHLHLLPPDMLRDYNVADTVATLALYRTLTDKFAAEGYDWGLDHILYMASARMIAESKGRGILVDREALAANLEATGLGIGQVWEAFQERFRIEIGTLELENLQKIVSIRKTEKGQVRAWEACIEKGLHLFNLTSTKQKARLFIDLLRMKPRFHTKKGAPAFGKAFLAQWGEGGQMLAKRGTMMIALKQMEALYELSEYDGRYHPDLRAAGTKTSRMKGGNHDT